MRDVADQRAHRDDRAHERRCEADPEDGDVVDRQQVAMFQQVVDRGGRQRRDRQEERELRRGPPRETEEHPADDRRPGPRGAGDQRERLGEPDLQRVAGAHRVDLLDARLPVCTLEPQDHDAADHEGRRDGHRMEEVGLDVLAEQQPQNSRRHEGDQQIHGEASLRRIAREPAHREREAPPIFPAHRQDRTELDGDRERLLLLAGEAQQLLGDDEMARARDRQELGESLDDAEDQRLEENDGIHGGGGV